MISLNPDSLTERAILARAAEQGVTLDDLFAPWVRDQAGAAVDRAPLTEERVQAAEARAAEAIAKREADMAAKAKEGAVTNL